MKQNSTVIIATIFFIIIFSEFSFAQWVDIRPPHPIPPMPPRRDVPLDTESVRVTGEIQERAGTLIFEEVFFNSNPYQLEGTFYFPLLRGASIKDFAMWVNGEKISGEVLESGKARKIYEDIVRTMRDPALLEYMDENLFRCRIFPIPARERIKIEIKISQVLDFESGNIVLNIPLKQAVSRGNALGNFVVDLKIRSGTPVGNFYSPSCDIDVVRAGDGSYRISYEGSRLANDRDFSLSYRYMEGNVGVSVIGYRPYSSDGYFLMLLSPSWDISSHSISAKEIVYVVDCSGSMRKDGKLDQVKDALLFGLRGLNDEDMFNIISFSSEPLDWKENLVSVNKSSIAEAEDHIKNLVARGGTNINDAMAHGLSMFSARNVPKILVFLTDGQPTIGVTKPETILHHVSNLKKNNVRVFSFGVGYDVNTFLLGKLSEMQNGDTTYVDQRENLELKLSNFFEKIESPVLTDISVDFGKIRVSELYPVHVPDLFKGSQLTITGRYKNHGTTTLTVSGMMQGDEKQFKYRIGFPEHDGENDFLPHIWAARKIGFLLDEIRLHGEAEELVEEVIGLSKKHGIPTPYTSYLVTEDEAPPTADRFRHRRIVPMPLDTVSGEVDATARKKQFETARTVQEMKNVGGLSSIQDLFGKADEEKGSDSIPIRRVSEKTFRFIDGCWVDTEYEEKIETLRIKFLSRAYFDLLKLDPVLEKYLAIGNRVKISLGDTGLIIDEEGLEELPDGFQKKILRLLGK